ncbi:TPA: hypothetical protein ACTUT5_003449 [Legionella anisa]|uniref:hypothetical protein n=1 Tax=Legionella anisa TaxID=28082 RepID=UPI001981FD9B|nr:hypothetical protein [Legionella anisa]MBN5937378.1 hypothetical protein [Legionella anisa]
MPLLVLDLDETVIVSPGRLNLINAAHSLSAIRYKSLAVDPHGRLGYLYFQIINPDQIANLIEYAYTNNNHIMILTSGLWLPSIRNELANNLNLSDNARERLKNCYFHSAYTDSIVFNFPTEHAQKLDKNNRLRRIIDSRPELAGTYSTVLDNNRLHVDSFKNNRKVKAILANTDQENLNFYDKAKMAIDECGQHEQFNLGQHGLFGKNLKREIDHKSMPEEKFAEIIDCSL